MEPIYDGKERLYYIDEINQESINEVVIIEDKVNDFENKLLTEIKKYYPHYNKLSTNDKIFKTDNIELRFNFNSDNYSSIKQAETLIYKSYIENAIDRNYLNEETRDISTFSDSVVYSIKVFNHLMSSSENIIDREISYNPQNEHDYKKPYLYLDNYHYNFLRREEIDNDGYNEEQRLYGNYLYEEFKFKLDEKENTKVLEFKNIDLITSEQTLKLIK